MSLFDPSSGQVYAETTASVQSMIPAWMTQARGRRDDPSKHQNRSKGCPTLQQMTLRSCVWRVDQMEPEALQWLGWHYASRIYDRVKDTDTLTFNIWSIFQKAFPEHIDRHHHFHVSGREELSFVPAQLPSMIDRIARLDANMLTFLCIQNFSLEIDDLLALTKVHTLAALVLDRRCGISDPYTDKKAVRDWGRAVCETGAYKKLQLLILRNFDVDKRTILQAVSKFPALGLVAINDSISSGDETRGPYEDWCDVNLEWLTGKIPSPEEKNPDSIWYNHMMTIVQKTQLLYDLSNELLQKPTLKTAPVPSLTVTYSNGRGCISCGGLAWVFRELKNGIPQPTKRPRVQNGNVGKKENPDKKRKIREVKKTDIGSLLNTFV